MFDHFLNGKSAIIKCIFSSTKCAPSMLNEFYSLLTPRRKKSLTSVSFKLFKVSTNRIFRLSMYLLDMYQNKRIIFFNDTKVRFRQRVIALISD